MLGLSAAALGLALFQGRARAGETARVSTPITTEVTVRREPVLKPPPLQGPPTAAITSSMLDYSSSTKEALHYRMMQLFAAPVYGKILAVLAVAAPILALGSFMYHKAAGGSSWSESWLKPYAVLLNCPGGCWPLKPFSVEQQ